MRSLKPVRLASSLLVSAFLVRMMAIPLVADVLYWDGSDGNSWGTVGNWDNSGFGGGTPAAIPGATDDVVFNATVVVPNQISLLGANQSVNSLTFNATTNINLAAGNTLTLYGATINMLTGAGSNTLGCAIALGDPSVGAGAFVATLNNASTNTLKFNGNFSKANAGTTWSLLVDGGGRVEFGGGSAQTIPFASATVQNGSALRMTGNFAANTWSFGTSGSVITLDNGRFELAQTSSQNPLNVQNAWNIAAGGGRIETFRLGNPNESYTFSGAITLGGNLYIRTSYGGSGASTYSGAVTVTGGDRLLTVDTGGNGYLGNYTGAIGEDAERTLTIRQGRSAASTPLPVTIFTGNNTISHVVVQSSGLLETGPIRFGNVASLPELSLKIETGAFAGFGFSSQANWDAALPLITADSTGVLGIDANTAVNLDLSAAGIDRDLRVGGSGAAVYTGTLTPYGTTYKLGGGGGSLIFTGVNAITGNRDLDVSTQAGLVGGTIVLSNANDFVGSITVGAGQALLAVSDAALGDGANSVVVSGTLGPAGAVTTARALTVNTGATLSGGAAGASLTINTPTANATFGNVTLASAGGILTINTDLQATDGTITLSNGDILNTIRLGGNNSTYTNRITIGRAASGFGNSLTLMSPGAMIGGHIDANLNANNGTRLFLNGAGSPGTYTLGIGTAPGEVQTTTAGTPPDGSGIVAFGGNVNWDPGNGGDYTLGTVSSNRHLLFLGARQGGDFSRINFGNSASSLILNGGLTLTSRNGALTTNPLRMEFALSDNGSAQGLTLRGTHLVLTRASTGTANSTLTVGTSATGQNASLAISDVNQLPLGNLNLAYGVLIADNLPWATLIGARPFGNAAGQLQFSANPEVGFAARGSALVIDDTGTDGSTFDRSFTLGSVARDSDGSYYGNAPVEISREIVFTSNRTLTTQGDGNTHRLSGQLTLNPGATLTKAGAGNLRISGLVTGSGALSLGAGSVEFAGGTNDFSGGTTIGGAAVTINAADALGTGSVVLNSGSLRLNAGPMGSGAFTQAGGTLQMNADALAGGAYAINGGTIMALGAARTIANDGTIGGSFTMGVTNTFGITLAGDLVVSGARTITLPLSGPGLTGAATTGVVQRISGNLSGNGALFIQSTATGAGNVVNNAIGEIVLAGQNTMTGSLSGGSGSVYVNAGPGGLAIFRQSAFVRFDDTTLTSGTSVPQGDGSTPAQLISIQQNANQINETGSYCSGFLFTGDADGQSYSLPAHMRIVEGSVDDGNRPSTLGATSMGVAGGNATLARADILINCGTASQQFLALLVRDGVFALGEGSSAVNFMPSRGFDTVASTTRTAFLDSTGTRTLIKRGPGTLALSNVAYTDLAGSVDKTSQFSWQLGRGGVDNTPASPYFDGAVRETGNAANNSLSGFNVRFQGAVLEGSDAARGGLAFTRGLGSAANQVQWLQGGGGFAAYDGAFTVNIGGGASPTLTWGSGGFVTANNPLIFGSLTANDVVTFQNHIGLNGGLREVRVIDNPDVATDWAILSGNLAGTGTSGLNKTGEGTLVVSGNNAYTGHTLVAQGKLLYNGTLAAVTGGSNVTVKAGATLGGNGTISRDVILEASSLLAPGTSPGVLTAASMTLDSMTYLWELGNGPVPGDYDSVSLTDLTFNPGAQITLALFSVGAYVPQAGDVFTLFSVANAPNGFDADNWTLDYGTTGWAGGTVSQNGNDIVLSGLAPVPEPATLVLLGLGGALAAWRRRKQA